MPILYIRNFPVELLERIKTLAARNQRSLSEEVVAPIDQAIKQEEVRGRRAETLKNIAQRRRSYKAHAGDIDTLAMLRQDRRR